MSSVPVMDASTLQELVEQYKLTNINQQVSAVHLEAISRTCIEKWKSLPPYLGLDTTVADDIDKSEKEPAEKRYDFLKKWKQCKGSGATYRQLINALLRIDCRDDAECVCKMLDSQPQLLTSSATVLSLQNTGISSPFPS